MDELTEKISVIIPVYNAEKYLDKCLKSVVGQTYQNLEIICIDDGSTDRSGEILDEFACNDSRILVIHRANGGLVSARKAGVELASGPYTCYVDADDWIDPEMYMTMFREGVKYGADIVSVGFYREFEDGSSVREISTVPQGIYHGKEIADKVLPQAIITSDFFQWGLPMTLWHYLFKTELLRKNQLAVDDRICMGEDIVCSLFCLYQCTSISVIDKYFYHYRQSNLSMKRTSKIDGFQRSIFLYQSLKNRAAEFEDRTQLNKKIDYVIFFELLLTAYDSLLRGRKILFPFSNVKKGDRIVIYGAGIFGEEMYETIKRNNYCEISGWIDSRFSIYQNNVKPVSAPQDILDMEYDYVVIAVTNPEHRRKIIGDLLGIGAPVEKIADIDMRMLTHDMLPDEFIANG